MGVVIKIREYGLARETLCNQKFVSVYTRLRSRKNSISDFNSGMTLTPPYTRLLNDPKLVDTPDERVQALLQHNNPLPNPHLTLYLLNPESCHVQSVFGRSLNFLLMADVLDPLLLLFMLKLAEI